MAEERSCGFSEVRTRMLATMDSFVQERRRIEADLDANPLGTAFDPLEILTIPVVVHVVTHTSDLQVTDAQVASQIDAMNRDFRKTNDDVANVPPLFENDIGDARIEFELADIDPDGTPTMGINRVDTDRTGFLSDDTVKSADTGGVNPWPNDRYLNIWVCNLTDYLGYATFPGAPANLDGIVVRDRAFGTTGSAEAPFHLGRTCTHEVGHFLNLEHIWGDDPTRCSSDGVMDTPDQVGPNRGSLTGTIVSCGSEDMYMNYMDYVNDDTMVMFTNGQISRMRRALKVHRPGLARVGAPLLSDEPLVARAPAPTGWATANEARLFRSRLEAHYLLLLQHYEALQANGLLDYTGLEAFRQIREVYDELTA